MTVTGKGSYTGSLAATFEITAKKMTPTVKLAASSYVWTGKAVKPSVTVKASGKKLSGSDYSVFKAGNDYLLDHDMISQEEYNDRFEAIEPTEQEVYDLLESMSMQNGEFKPEVVHEIPYSDYVIQQPTPEHLFDHVDRKSVV